MSATKQIELTKPHRHAGRDYKAGARLALRESQADWLIGIDRAKAVAPEAVAPATTKKSAKE